jgi:hypothetical protein
VGRAEYALPPFGVHDVSFICLLRDGNVQYRLKYYEDSNFLAYHNVTHPPSVGGEGGVFMPKPMGKALRQEWKGQDWPFRAFASRLDVDWGRMLSA